MTVCTRVGVKKIERHGDKEKETERERNNDSMVEGVIKAIGKCSKEGKAVFPTTDERPQGALCTYVSIHEQEEMLVA